LPIRNLEHQIKDRICARWRSYSGLTTFCELSLGIKYAGCGWTLSGRRGRMPNLEMPNRRETVGMFWNGSLGEDGCRCGAVITCFTVNTQQ
jgi:hypothetical protein